MKNLVKLSVIAFAFAAFTASCDQAATTETTEEVTTEEVTPETPVVEPAEEAILVDTAAAPADAVETAPAQ